MFEVPAALFAPLVAAHLVADFGTQTRESLERKSEPRELLGHAAIVALLSYLVCGLWASWQIPTTVLASHALIDWMKTRWGRGGALAFGIDQLAHVAVLAALAGWVARSSGGAVGFWQAEFGGGFLQVTVLVAGAALTTLAGRPIVGFIIKPFADEIEDSESRGFVNGGSLIGLLERALIFVVVVAGWDASFGFLIAAKSIFRFGELKDTEHRKQAEYIIIGTLSSFLHGLVFALLTRAALTALG